MSPMTNCISAGHTKHSQGPRQTLPLRPPPSRAMRLSQAAPCALVGALQIGGRHPPVRCLSPLPTFLRGCSTWAAAQCSQPPLRYQSRGYGGAALAALLLKLPQPQQLSRCGCSSCPAQLSCSSSLSANAVALQALQPLCCCSMWAAAHCSQPPPRYQYRGYGGYRCATSAAFLLQLAAAIAVAVVLSYCCGYNNFPAAITMQQHYSCCQRGRCLAATACRLQLSAANPASLPMRGLWRRCTSTLSFAAATIVLQ